MKKTVKDVKTGFHLFYQAFSPRDTLLILQNVDQSYYVIAHVQKIYSAHPYRPRKMDKKHVKNLQWEFEKNMNFIDSDSPNSDWSEKITSDWIEMASSDEPDPFDYINTKLNLFQVIQLYLINDIYENHEGIYSTLYNIINDIKLSINLKELNQTLNGYVSTHKKSSDFSILILDCTSF